jgi:hypothetical protein
MLTTLAQLSDVMPLSYWMLFMVVGLAAPAAGWLLSILFYGLGRRRALVVTAFYAPALPLAGYVLITRTADVLIGCSFMALWPLGIVLGLGILLPWRRTQKRA